MLPWGFGGITLVLVVFPLLSFTGVKIKSLHGGQNIASRLVGLTFSPPNCRSDPDLGYLGSLLFLDKCAQTKHYFRQKPLYLYSLYNGVQVSFRWSWTERQCLNEFYPSRYLLKGWTQRNKHSPSYRLFGVKSLKFRYTRKLMVMFIFVRSIYVFVL